MNQRRKIISHPPFFQNLQVEKHHVSTLFHIIAEDHRCALRYAEVYAQATHRQLSPFSHV